MSSLLLRVGDAQRRPLTELMDVYLLSPQTNMLARQVRDVTGSVRFTDLLDHYAYVVQVHPQRHRAVGAPVVTGADESQLDLYAPLDPSKATATFPLYADLPAALRAVLEPVRYADCTPEQKAGLLNVYAKMASVGVWGEVRKVCAVRGDRVFAEVNEGLWAYVWQRELFRQVDGSLHDPPHGYRAAKSFKTLEPYGNLQLTFFASQTQPEMWLVDADIDDAAGLGHVFQVLGHALTHGTTHPYDIHEILTFRQDVVLPYSLA